ncbi:uncharacterized protein BBA_08976 [Beauveria bassiana ARSEF 2860]|uniref:Tse2 ADP-ribosyltransferase toxin domain-containing protein n=1 Tax=Beauveria bassiana (strain ARSEF 2860) TaxID=655819 RepID=J4UGM0_BEAB2|nr:uncharacterized protein BBA_08976 [Beauveria bassiana ARSEF 2860]EJP62052.1 hypothetical protein BBA_08976 [Beauveria bassiana ARSEF 2860]
MQKFIRRYYDEFLDRKEADENTEEPRIFTIPKATAIPESLILIHEFHARFSLQPSRGMPLQELNRLLEAFFDLVTIEKSAERWLVEHPYHSAIADEAEDT